MALGDDYIPNENSLFFPWQDNLVTMVSTNAVAWGIPAPKVTELTGKQTIYVGLYNTANTPSTKTKAANVAHEAGRKVYEKYIRGFVNEFLINNSAITVQEKINCGLNPHLNTGGSRPAIETMPHTTIKALGGGIMKLENRVESDSSRASRHRYSDGVEIHFAIVNAQPGGPGGVVYPPAEECPFHHFSSKATFKLDLGTGNMGKLLVAYTRWKNNSNAEKNGPITSLPAIGLIT